MWYNINVYIYIYISTVLINCLQIKSHCPPFDISTHGTWDPMVPRPPDPPGPLFQHGDVVATPTPEVSRRAPKDYDVWDNVEMLVISLLANPYNSIYS